MRKTPRNCRNLHCTCILQVQDAPISRGGRKTPFVRTLSVYCLPICSPLNPNLNPNTHDNDGKSRLLPIYTGVIERRPCGRAAGWSNRLGRYRNRGQGRPPGLSISTRTAAYRSDTSTPPPLHRVFGAPLNHPRVRAPTPHRSRATHRNSRNFHLRFRSCILRVKFPPPLLGRRSSESIACFVDRQPHSLGRRSSESIACFVDRVIRSRERSVDRVIRSIE